MTSKKAIKKLKELQKMTDPEITHKEADKILCQLLCLLGYEEVVAEFNDLKKWYS